MIEFVNAKINLGLNIVGKRDDGYHLLETLFYPIGVHNGCPDNPDRFNDILEISLSVERNQGIEVLLNGRGDTELQDVNIHEGIRDNRYPGITYIFNGNKVDCEIDKHLVVMGVRLMMDAFDVAEGQKNIFHNRVGDIIVNLYKQLPDGAGMGGGSADASFAVRMLNEIGKKYGLKGFTPEELEKMVVTLGADCPIFIRNRPAYAEGIGEEMVDFKEVLKGKWSVVVKPDLHISTKEAFAGVRPRKPDNSIRDICTMEIPKWKELLKNDFEDSLFPAYPILKQLKEALYAAGAEYASMTGSGSALYGIYASESEARNAYSHIEAPFKVVCKM